MVFYDDAGSELEVRVFTTTKLFIVTCLFSYSEYS